jgi:hypothetical protein
MLESIYLDSFVFPSTNATAPVGSSEPPAQAFVNWM